MSDDDAPESRLTVLVYSDDHTTRAAVRRALGRRPAADLAEIEYIEVATEPAIIARADKGGIDLLVLDGEAVPAGGMGVCRQLKDEIFNCPPVLLLIARQQDAWLAHWSKADGVVSAPLDPFELANVAAGLLRRRVGLATG
jgi:DNA-binding response OmpR family regulator